MSWKLYLDDVRPLPEQFVQEGSFIVARSCAAAQALVLAKGAPSFISFDHDLGFEPDGSEINGKSFAIWLCDQDMDGVINIDKEFSFAIHSSNPAGRINIESYMKSYLKSKRGS